MKNSVNSYQQQLHKAAKFIGRAQVKGKLFDFGEYPGAVYEPYSDTLIFGELYEIVDQSVWSIIDEYEGCSIQDEKPHEYIRIDVEASCEDGRKFRCQFYQYNWDISKGLIIESGVYSPG